MEQEFVLSDQPELGEGMHELGTAEDQLGPAAFRSCASDPTDDVTVDE